MARPEGCEHVLALAPGAASQRAAHREGRVSAGLAELDRWLCDQVRQGLAETQRAGGRHWDSMAAQLADAQAPGVAALVRELVAIPRSGTSWAGHLLEEYALLRLLTAAHRGRHGLPAPLRETVRSRIGFTTGQSGVPTSGGAERVADRWDVLGLRDLEQESSRIRRVWLRGQQSGRMALTLSATVAGQVPDGSWPAGTCVDAELAFSPAAVPLRVAVVSRQPVGPAGTPPGITVATLLDDWAAALTQDPWLDAWPAVLAGVVPARAPATPPGDQDGWLLADAAGDALPLHPGAPHRWPLIAVSGGHPVTVAGEWTPSGFWPLTVWGPAGAAVPL